MKFTKLIAVSWFMVSAFTAAGQENDLVAVNPTDFKHSKPVTESQLQLGQVYEHTSSIDGTHGSKKQFIFKSRYQAVALPAALPLLGEQVIARSFHDVWKREGEKSPLTVDKVVGDLRLPWWPLTPGTLLKGWRFGREGEEAKAMFLMQSSPEGSFWELADASLKDQAERIVTLTYGGWSSEMGWKLDSASAGWQPMPRISANPVKEPWKVTFAPIKGGIAHEVYKPELGDFQYCIEVMDSNQGKLWRLAPGTLIPRSYFSSTPQSSTDSLRLDAVKGNWSWTEVTGVGQSQYKMVNADNRAVYSYLNAKWQIIHPTLAVAPPPAIAATSRPASGWQREYDFGPPTQFNGGSGWGGHSALSDYILYETRKDEYPFGGPPTGWSFRDYIEWKDYQSGKGR